MTALSSFTPTGAASIVANGSSQNVLLPTAGTPTIAIVTNVGNDVAYLLLGTSNAVAVTPSTGLALLPGDSINLTIGSNTYLAAIGSTVTIAVGN
ncbi:MAG: hypothetical protein WCE63_07450 [Acidobacteriaceae bacterium]